MSRLILSFSAAAPSAPATDKISFYVDANGNLRAVNGIAGLDVAVSPDCRPNLIRNSGWWFAQRQVPTTLTTYNNVGGRTYCADGWFVSNENASLQFRQVSNATPETGLPAPCYGEFTKITSTGKMLVGQILESVDAMAVRGKVVRLTAWMKQIVGVNPVVRLGLAQLTSAGTIDTVPVAGAAFVTAWGANTVDPTLGTAVSLITPTAGYAAETGTITGAALSCTLTAVWQRFSVLVTVPTDCKNLIVVIFGNAQFAAAAGFAVGPVMLTSGLETQTWSPMPYNVEFARCQRYYYKTFPPLTAPAQLAGTTTGALTAIIGKAAATALAAFFQVRYPVPMFKSPSLTLYNPATANTQARRVSGAAAADQTATTTQNSNLQSVEITATGDAAGAVGDQVQIHMTADAEL